MAADRRRLAPAAASAERAACSGRRVVPIRGVGRRHLDRGVRGHGRRDRVDCSCSSPDRKPAAVAGAAVFAFNPNVLYLQSTPMTEPLLMGLMTLAVAMLLDWTTRGRESFSDPVRAVPARPNDSRPLFVGWVFALACLTRYEAWPVTAAALAAAAWALWRQGESPAAAAAPRGGHRHCSRQRRSRGFSFSAASSSASGSSRAGSSCPKTLPLAIHSCAAGQIWFGLHRLSGSLALACWHRRGDRADCPWRDEDPMVPRAHRRFARRDRGASVARVRRGPSVPDPLHGAAVVLEAIGAGVAVGLARRVLPRITTFNAETAEHAE